MTASATGIENLPTTTEEPDDGPSISLPELLAWIGEGKRPIAAVSAAAALISLVVALLLPNVFTARATLLPPGSQQQSGSAAALAALGALGGLGGLGGLGAKTPDELYVALLKSDTVQRALVERFDLAKRWDLKTYEQLRREFGKYVRISAEKKSGLISVEVDDEDPAFAARFANAYDDEITRLLGRLAVSEAQSRRVYFEKQLKETREHLVAAELGLRKVMETSGVIVLDKQAEALITGAARLQAQIAEREVALSVLRRSATEKNPDVQRMSAELAAMRDELGRMESSPANDKASPLNMPVNKLSEASVEYVRARRELKIQEALLEAMIRQYEIAKLDEAKEGPLLQVVDVAVPPDRKSKPMRSLIVLASTLLAALAASAWAVWRGYRRLANEADPEAAQAWTRVGQAWRWRR
jgi:uncharacterized protein involved in exopolysaccharide biosynthesis